MRASATRPPALFSVSVLSFWSWPGRNKPTTVVSPQPHPQVAIANLLRTASSRLKTGLAFGGPTSRLSSQNSATEPLQDRAFLRHARADLRQNTLGRPTEEASSQASLILDGSAGASSKALTSPGRRTHNPPRAMNTPRRAQTLRGVCPFGSSTQR